MPAPPLAKKPYERLLSGVRIRVSKVTGRSLEEEAEADRGRVLFCAPFRRLQNKAQMFSLETNASVRSRLTHSFEVSSVGRFVTQQAIRQFGAAELDALGIAGNERALITFVETACLLHDIGTPPFGHFGEIAISDWFHLKSESLQPTGIGGSILTSWQKYFADFKHFDGNPQGLRICTRLQPSQTSDLCGLNLTATTLAAFIKYPWTAEKVDETHKKAGFFLTEADVVDWLNTSLQINSGARHPLVYLMEAADDIAYCISDIEDGIEKGLVSAKVFAESMQDKLRVFKDIAARGDNNAKHTLEALALLKQPAFIVNGVNVRRLTPMQDFRSAITRFLALEAGKKFKASHAEIIAGTAPAILRDANDGLLLKSLKEFASSTLYSSSIVRNREITAQAVLSGLLDAYLPLMICERARFDEALSGKTRDEEGRPIARDSSLASRISGKCLEVYREAVARLDITQRGKFRVMERIYRIHLILDHLTGMTDEFALQSFQLISGVQINPYRN